MPATADDVSFFTMTADPPTALTSDPAVSDHLRVRLFMAALIRIDRTWNAANVRSSFWRLYVNQAAGASLRLPTGRHTLTAGDVHLVPAWTRFTCHNTRLVRHLYLHFDLLPLPATVVQTLFPKPISIKPNALTRAAIDTLRGHLERDQADSLAVIAAGKTAVYATWHQLLTQLDAQRARQLARFAHGAHPMSAVLDHIEQHLHTSLTNRALARQCHLSENQFIRRFRDTVGQTPAQYVLERRVSRAAELLLFTAAGIDDIAARTGFANRFHFTRMFTQRMGVSPAAYRDTDRV